MGHFDVVRHDSESDQYDEKCPRILHEYPAGNQTRLAAGKFLSNI